MVLYVCVIMPVYTVFIGLHALVMWSPWRQNAVQLKHDGVNPTTCTKSGFVQSPCKFCLSVFPLAPSVYLSPLFFLSVVLSLSLSFSPSRCRFFTTFSVQRNHVQFTSNVDKHCLRKSKQSVKDGHL